MDVYPLGINLNRGLSVGALTLLALLPAGATAQGPARASIERGEELYGPGCLSCHGPEGRGVPGTGPPSGTEGTQQAGPSLRGVGAASVDFYLTTGYMPLENADDPPKRRDPSYSPEEIRDLIAYIDSLGDGPPIPEITPQFANPAEGAELFTEHCAGCHQVAAEGGVVLGAVAPDLERATATQIAEAVRIGPYLMPKFSEKQIDDRQLASIARYVLDTKHDPRDEGGWGIGHIGPIPEGFMAWAVALLVLVGIARLIGKRAEVED